MMDWVISKKIMVRKKVHWLKEVDMSRRPDSELNELWEGSEIEEITCCG